MMNEEKVLPVEYPPRHSINVYLVPMHELHKFPFLLLLKNKFCISTRKIDEKIKSHILVVPYRYLGSL